MTSFPASPCLILDHSGYHLRNLGDLAMLQGAVKRISRLADVEINVIVSDPARLRRFIPEAVAIDHHLPMSMEQTRMFPVPYRLLPSALRSRVVEGESFARVSNPRRWIQRSTLTRSESTEQWLGILKRCDAVVATGGGYLTDSFEAHAMRVLSHLSLALSLGKPVALLGQGIGPLESPRLSRAVRHVLPQATCLGLREPLGGPAWLQAAGLPPGVVTGDDALELIDFEDPSAAAKSSCVGLNIRRSAYAGLTPEIYAVLRAALGRIIGEMGLAVCPTPIDFVKEDNDERAALECISEGQLDPTYERPESPRDVIRLVARCRLVVTGSYHAALFSLAQGVPVVGIQASAYYESKFAGLNAIYANGVSVLRCDEGEDMEAALRSAMRTALTLPESIRDGWKRTSSDLSTRGRSLVGAFLAECADQSRQF